MLHLSPRLQSIADMLLSGAVLADIGTDHAYVPCYAVATGLSPRAIACDINQDPIRTARETVARLGLSDQVEIRLGPGLEVLKDGEVEQIVIAGMGGNTICEIIGMSLHIAQHVKRLIIQPMIRIAETRQWLMEHGFAIVDERMAEEGHHLYRVMAIEPGEQRLTASELEYGPCLITRREPLLRKLLQRDLGVTEHIISNLKRSSKINDKITAFEDRRYLIQNLIKQWNE